MPIRKWPKGGYQIDASHNGRRIKRVFKISRQDALALEKRFLEQLREEERRELLGLPPAATLGDAIARYLEERQHLKSYKNLIDKARHWLPLEQVLLESCVPAVNQQKAEWQRTPSRSNPKEMLQPATINRRLAIVRCALNLAYAEWEWLDHPLAQKIKLLREDNERHIYLTPEQLYALADAAKEAKELVLLAAFTGLRQGEMLGLTRSNIDGSTIILDAKTKSGKPRPIPIPQEMGFLLDAIPAKLTYSMLRNRWENARKVVGMEYLHWHDLRHTYAGWIASKGTPLFMLRDLLGHSNISVTNRYVHLQKDHLEKAVSGLPVHIAAQNNTEESTNTLH